MIDRYELVNRHNPELRELRIDSPLTVGNGEFAFTADITGLQSFPEIYRDEVPLCTMAQWGWHSFSPEREYERSNLKLKLYKGKNRNIAYASEKEGQENLFDFLRENPHKFHLGQIGLNIKKSNGKKIDINDIEDIKQKLDLWQGILESEFTVQGILVSVKTICHPYRDLLAVSVESELINRGRLSIDINFPYPSVDKSAANWDRVDGHESRLFKKDDYRFEFHRLIDSSNYFLSFLSSSKGNMTEIEKHHYQYEIANNNRINFFCEFTEKPRWNENLEYKEVENSSKRYWYNYWNNGGIIDLSDCLAERAEELERRIILSQYLTAIQCSGTYPPQETGLTCNSWYGKFHLEMHLWHGAHFPFWNRAELLERSLWWYHSILDRAEELAVSQGYKGVRWPKMVGPEGYDSPSSIGPFLIWQQPHPIFYAEILYRTKPTVEILEYYKDIVFRTADFMVSYADYDGENDRFILGPPLIPAQECFRPNEVINPSFELEYWDFALKIAQIWRKRLGLGEDPKWQRVIEKLSQLPVLNNLYLSHEKCPDTFTKKNYDHPSMVGAFGLLPGSKVNKDIMLNTLKKCLSEWNFADVWGWDFPMLAMTAARLGEKELAVDLLLMDSPKNTYLANGHNRQGMKKDLPLYLPGNGALLLAVGMMAAGWSDSPAVSTPGFPDDESWNVKYENINKYF